MSESSQQLTFENLTGLETVLFLVSFCGATLLMILASKASFLSVPPSEFEKQVFNITFIISMLSLLVLLVSHYSNVVLPSWLRRSERDGDE